MDPAGIREILLVRPYVNNPYQFESVARGLPYKTRIRAHYSSIPWLPLSEPLTQRVSTQSEGYAGFGQYDCLVIAGTDLESCAERDIQHIRSAMERGLPVMVCGGAFGLGRSYRLWHDLEEGLPARIPAGEPFPCECAAEAAGTHDILKGLPQSFGFVSALHQIEPSPDARVILSAGGHPVLVAGERFGSRQLVLAVAYADGLWCDGLDTEGFYGHPFYADLIRQSLSWLMGAETPLRLDSLEMETGLRLQQPGPHVFRAAACCEEEVDGAELRCSLYGVDEARLMSGGDTIRTEVLHEETRTLSAGRQSETFSLEDPRPRKTSGLYEVELSLEMASPPQTPPNKAFAMAAPPQWSNWKGPAADSRRFRLRFADQRRATVTVPGWGCTLQEGESWSVRVQSQTGGPAALSIVDDKQDEVARVTGKAGPETQDLAWGVPPLREGDYTAILSVAEAGDEEEFHFALKSVNPPDPDHGFQLVGHFRSDYASDEELEERIRTCLESFGLDTLSVGGLDQAEALWGESTSRLEQPRSLRRLRWIDAVIASHDQNLWTDFDKQMIVLATHGASESYAPTEPCVHHPDYESAVRATLVPALRLQDSRPGHISTEIIDEPHLYPSNVCRCEICLRLYREAHGEEMPAWDELLGDQTPRRWRFFQWLEDYTNRTFAATQKVKQEEAPEIHLHNVAIDRLFSSNFKFSGMHHWAKYGDEIYMACYPWSYLSHRGLKQAPHSQTHWIAAWIRGLASHYGIPWGVFMEIWEHDVPNRWLPPYWSVGQFYALLVAGARRLDTFILSFSAEVFGISDARLREFGFEVNKVRPFFPLLAAAQRPRARMAFINPWCQWVMDPQPHYLPPDHEGYGYYRRYAIPFDRLYPNENRHMLAYELFRRTFSDLDQVDEQLFCEAEEEYQAIVVSDCSFLMQKTMGKLESFVTSGGVLILDCEPDRDESGETTGFYRELTSGDCVDSGVVVPGLDYEIFRAGKGHILRFSSSLQDAFGDALEGERKGIRERFEQTVTSLLNQVGLVPRWQIDCGDLDIGIRQSEGVCLVPVANLCPERRAGTAIVRDLGFEPGFAANLTDGSFIDWVADGGDTRIDIDLEGYHGALLAFFPDRPENCRVQIASQDTAPGEPLEYEVRLSLADGSPSRSSYLVEVTVTDSRGEVHRRLGGPLRITEGLYTFRKNLPINGPTGTWTIAISDPLTGLSAEGEFSVR